MLTPERMRKYRQRQDAAGMKRISCALTPEGAEALQALLAISSGRNVGEVVSAALITAALAKVRKDS